MKNTLIALLAALPLKASPDTQLVPFGEFVGRDGRPGKGLTWKFSNDAGRALAAKLNARHVKTRFNLDYEHQALMAEKNGQPAPASGWTHKFEWRDGDGLYSLNTAWTARAKQMIEADEYAYISPVIAYDGKTGEVTDLLMAALTNYPDLMELNAVAQERVARLNAEFSTDPENEPMNAILKALLEGLGLPANDTTTEAQATAALTALKAPRSDLTAILKSLGVAETTDGATACTAIGALKAKADKAAAGGEPDPAKWVSVENFNKLNEQVVALSAKGVGREVDELIEKATADGKCAGVVADVWRNIGKADVAQLRALIEKTPANPALAGLRQTDKTNLDQGGGDTLSAEEIAVCSATGIAREDFLKTRKELASAGT
ncbi:MAG: hypothetical protein HYX47_10275 [Burkholderiales bacterium]|nr:hypothetical protein [Burkholderiales bacterium]